MEGLGGSITLSFIIKGAFDGEACGEALEKGLSKYYDPDLVYYSGQIYDRSSDQLGIGVDIDSNSVELETDPENFLKEVASVSKKILLRTVPDLKARDVAIQIVLDNEEIYTSPGWV